MKLNIQTLKKIFIGSLFYPTIASTNTTTINIPVLCTNIQVVLQHINNKKEIPIYTGINSESRSVLFFNKSTGTWSMVRFDKDVACIYLIGINGKILFDTNSDPKQ